MKKGKTLEQIKEQKQKFRARMRIVYIFLALVLMLAGAYLLMTRYFIINEITVSDSIYYKAQEIIDITQLEKGKSIFTCKDKKLEERIYTLFPYISKVDVNKRFPDTIEINIEEQDGLMYVSLLSESYALNADLKVLGKIKNTDKKIRLETTGVRRCIVGEKVQFADDNAYELIKEIYGELCSINANEKTVYVDINDRFNIFFNYDNRFDVYIGDDELIGYKMKIFEKVIADFPQDTGKITISSNGRAVILLDDF